MFIFMIFTTVYKYWERKKIDNEINEVQNQMKSGRLSTTELLELNSRRKALIIMKGSL